MNEKGLRMGIYVRGVEREPVERVSEHRTIQSCQADDKSSRPPSRSLFFPLLQLANKLGVKRRNESTLHSEGIVIVESGKKERDWEVTVNW